MSTDEQEALYEQLRSVVFDVKKNYTLKSFGRHLIESGVYPKTSDEMQFAIDARRILKSRGAPRFPTEKMFKKMKDAVDAYDGFRNAKEIRRRKGDA